METETVQPTVTFDFLGWCNTDGHDKVWGVLIIQGERYTFWGKRDAKMTFKKPPDREIDKLRDSKLRKGYRHSSWQEQERLYPGWVQRFEEELVLARLGNFFHPTNRS